MNLAIIGCGTIAKLALETLAAESIKPIDNLILVTRQHDDPRALEMRNIAAAGIAKKVRIVSDVGQLLGQNPTLIAEAAGHSALQQYGPAGLLAGVDIIVASVGALASKKLRDLLDAAALQGNAQYEIIPGAVGGLDILAAAKLSGLTKVLYRSRKPPVAWRNTAAERIIDLENVREPITFFSGNAGDAARQFPQNANVAATIALKGAGLEATQVELVADPNVSRNIHELDVRAGSADFTLRIEGRTAPGNPKTSLTTAYSFARSILNRLPH